MSRTGYLIKVVPGNGHLKEFRELAKDHLRKSEYSNQSLVDYFEKHFELVERKLVSKTFNMPLEDREIFADMTQTETLTVEGEILIGRPLDREEKPAKTKKAAKSEKGKGTSKSSSTKKKRK